MLCLDEEKEGMIIIIKLVAKLGRYISLQSKYIEGRLKRKVGVREKNYLVSTITA